MPQLADAPGEAGCRGGGGESSLSAAKKGLRVARAAVQMIGPALPFPGAEAAALLLAVLDAVDAAVANTDNLAALRDRALAFLDILGAYTEELGRLPKYKEYIGEYMDLLQGIRAYAEAYASRNCLVRLLTAGSDAAQYEDLVSRMGVLGEQVLALVAVDTNARVQSVQASVDESAALLRKMASYQDPSAAARGLVAELGGIDVVLADGSKLAQVMQTLDISSQVTVGALSELLKAHTDKGPQRHIRQPELRLFWFKTYGVEDQVPWYVWWHDFPEQLLETVDVAAVRALKRLFEDDAARQAFQRSVELGDPDSVSVWELKRAFGEDRLLLQLRRLVRDVVAASDVMLDLCDGGGSSIGLNGASATGAAAAAPAGSSTPVVAPQQQQKAASETGPHHQGTPTGDAGTPTAGDATPATGAAGPAVIADAVDTAAAGAGEKGGRRLVALAKKGLHLARVAIEGIGPALPFPGAEAAALLLAVLDAVDAAVANTDNLAALRDRALAFLDILGAYTEELGRLPKYKEYIGEYMDLLQGIRAYAEAYASRNCLVRLLTAGSDAAQYEDLVSRMGVLGEQVLALVAVDTNARVQSVQASVDESAALLRKMASYQDPSAAARGLVAELGGIDVVLADGSKLAQVMQTLDLSTRVTVQMMTSLLESFLDKGPQRHIHQPELRLFWRERYAGVSEVPWYEFWSNFPDQLSGIPIGMDLLEQLSALLADEAARQAFQRAVERGHKETVSVWELRVAFDGRNALGPQVEGLLQAASAAGVAAGPEAGAGQQKPEAAPRDSAPCQLPPLPTQYLGREGDAEEVAGLLASAGSLVLLAPAGLGKSCLAADVGFRLLRSGGAPGGVLWVDLREAFTAIEVEARFCAALGLTPKKEGNVARVGAAAQRLALAAGRSHDVAALVVVDNSEDALADEAAAAVLGGVVRQVSAEAPAVRLLLTSRSPMASDLPLGVRELGAISHDAAVQLVLHEAEDLSRTEAADVSVACQCVPLVLRLVAKALTAGRLCLEDLEQLRATGEAADPTAATVRLVLASLRRPHQLSALQLAVFPSAFDEEEAADVLDMPGPGQAQAVVAVLYQHGVLQAGSGRRRLMHMLVRQEAAGAGPRLDPKLRRRAEGRYVVLMLRLLREWGDMFRMGKEWRLALSAAREHMADVGRMLELLSSAEAADCVDPVACGLALTDNMRRLLEALGLIARLEAPCAELLRRVREAGGGQQQASQEQRGAVVALLAMSGWVNIRSGRYEAGEALAREALQEQLARSAADDLAAADVLACLAGALYMQDKPVEAEAHYRRALEIRQRALGEEHANTASSISDLALCLSDQESYAEAQELFEKALELRRRVLGDENPDVAASLNNLAKCLQAQDEYEEAEELYVESLRVRETVLGKEHPDVGQSLGNLALCIACQARFAEAEELYRRAVRVAGRALGAQNPDTRDFLDSLGTVMQAQSKEFDAKAILEELLA